MSIFNKQRLTDETFKLDIERMRKGWYSDKYFENIGQMLTVLAAEGYSSALHSGEPFAARYDDRRIQLQPGEVGQGELGRRRQSR